VSIVIFCIVEDAMGVIAVVDVAAGKAMLGIVMSDIMEAVAPSVFKSKLLCRFRRVAHVSCHAVAALHSE
jgi:hypothetical protein